MIPLVPVIVSQNAYILYVRALRFGDPVKGTAACRYERQAAQSRRRSTDVVLVIRKEKPLANLFVSG